MKLQTTKKAIKNSFNRIIAVSYCDAQYLLRYKRAFAYSCGVYGWACDYYEIGNTCISTGYDPIGKRVDWSVLKKLEDEARAIIMGDSENKEAEIDTLINKLIGHEN